MTGNLFVVSRLGQIRNVQTFIRQYGATRNHLAVLGTSANPGLTRTILRNTDDGLFDEVVTIVQPDRPVSPGRRKNRAVFEQVDELVTGMAARGVENVFLCNVDNYYSFFQRIAEHAEPRLTLNLLEEGLGTYANAGARAYTEDTTASWSDVAYRARAAGRACGQAARAAGLLAATLLSWVFRADPRAVKRALVSAVLVEPRYRYGTVTHFDNAYVCFPDRIRSDRIRIDHVHGLEFEVRAVAPESALAAIEDGAALFVSQKYVDAGPYLEILFRIFSEMGLRTVYFKFHPREQRAAFARQWDEIAARYPGLRVLAPEEIQPVPVEELMAAGKVGTLVGLTSTALMYGAAFFPSIDPVSIGERFSALARSGEYGIPRGALSEFRRDLEVFEDVSGVRQFATDS